MTLSLKVNNSVRSETAQVVIVSGFAGSSSSESIRIHTSVAPGRGWSTQFTHSVAAAGATS